MGNATARVEPKERFEKAYAAALDRWPVEVGSLRVPTRYGETHVLSSGAEHAPPLLLLPGGGATGVVWSAVVADLAAHHHCLAVDPIGQPGRSAPSTDRPGNPAQLTDWLGDVLDGVADGPVSVMGHSYGAWIALCYARAAPERVRGLVLVDPTDCFTPMGLAYKLHAVPLVLRPTAERQRRFLAWETGGHPLDPTWLDVVAAGADLGRPSVVLPKPFDDRELAALQTPTLVVVAGRSRAHDPARVAERAGRVLPRARIVTLASATHHTLPTEDPHELSRAAAEFLRREPHA